MPFCKLDDNGELIVSPNFVFGPGLELRAELKDTYVYPIEGWYWFDTFEEAYSRLATQITITRAQAKLALLHIGLLDTLEAFMANPTTPRNYKIAWEDALTFKRNSPTIVAVSQILNLTDEQVDELFCFGSSLKDF